MASAEFMANRTVSKMSPRIVTLSRPCAAIDARSAPGRLSLSPAALEWLASEFPGLRYDSEAGLIEGESEPRDVYDGETGTLRVGNDDATSIMDTYVRDSFSIKIELDSLDCHTTLREFMHEMVVPFFYLLSYADRYGTEAARQDLWDDYDHGNLGFQQYLSTLAEIADQGLARNDPCICGSGRKYKRCHLGEVERFKRDPRIRHLVQRQAG